ncbi:PH domain-containing protein [Thermophilibacter provencensis]|uniref:PH domain-containing protein n=1 Tax=Thermophilibacter provencensis TaxID=1852386 RepID=A0ABT7V2R1_9ACTN|nr:PH domain-containing protein [Thermophilibacter provencensis]MDM8270887.1 PH domain-containing protein [Thermophilibacter provencensis]
MGNLPSHRLDPRMLRVWYVSDAIGIVVVAVLAVVAWLVVRHLGGDVFWVYLVAGIIELVCVGDLLISPRVEMATWRYDVTPTDVDLYRGVFTKKRVLVPLVRVQHVQTKQGPILRANGLATVTISTAGESFEIPGLAEDDANELRDRVAELARFAKEDV